MLNILLYDLMIYSSSVPALSWKTKCPYDFGALGKYLSEFLCCERGRSGIAFNSCGWKVSKCGSVCFWYSWLSLLLYPALPLVVLGNWLLTQVVFQFIFPTYAEHRTMERSIFSTLIKLSLHTWLSLSSHLCMLSVLPEGTCWWYLLFDCTW